MKTAWIATLVARLRSGLGNRRLPLVAAGVALALTSPSLRNGLQADDFLHREILLGEADYVSGASPLTDLFSFVDGDPIHIRQRINEGGLPWWSGEGLRIAFFRPLSALTHLVDYRLWPDSPARMHLHSMLWYGTLVLLVALLYRQTLTPLWVAGLAALLYAVDDAHGVPVGWLANRNALVAATFGTGALLAYLRWRREDWTPGAVLAPVGLLLALLGSEAAVAVGAYMLAFEITLGRKPWRRRLAAMAPCALVGLGWWLAYRGFHFGAVGSGAYINPGRDPSLFATALLQRVPLLLSGQWLLPDADLFSYLSKPDAYSVIGVAVLVMSLMIVVLAPVLKHDPVARFWGLGMLLSTVPVAATFPTNRLLLFVGLGAMGLMAQSLAAWWTRADWLPNAKAWRRTARVMIWLLILDHGVGAPLRLPATSVQLARVTRYYLEAPLAKLWADGATPGKTAFFLNPPTAIMMVLIPYIRTDLADRFPRHTHVLSSGLHRTMDITRVDAHTLRIEPQGGFASAEVDRIFRNAHAPMQPDQRIELDAVSVHVRTVTADGRPHRVDFTFPKPLEDSSYVFIRHVKTGMERFVLPAMGETVRLDWSVQLGW